MILIFLWHIPSAIIPIVTIPAAVVLSFIPMKMFGISSNIMSLGGIAVAIGALVDAAVVVVENAHKKLEIWEATGARATTSEILIHAIQEVGRPSFFSLLVIAVSFTPVFALEAQEGRLFRPLAFTKNFAMAIAALLAITLDPAIRLLFTRLKNYDFRPAWACRITNAVLVGRMYPEEKHPIPGSSSGCTSRPRSSCSAIRGSSSPAPSSSCCSRCRPIESSAPSSCRP